MTVADLIATLSDFPQDAEVFFEAGPKTNNDWKTLAAIQASYLDDVPVLADFDSIKGLDADGSAPACIIFSTKLIWE